MVVFFFLERTLKYFWNGFYKQADVLKAWEDESRDEDKKMQDSKQKRVKIDPILAGRDYAPDEVWRSWP